MIQICFPIYNPITKEEEIRTDMREYYQNHGFEPRKPWAMVIRAAYARKDFVWN